jgi:antitoxin (DNA-binding transcriptional repressor) of toxin-antitoxin stability system
MQTSASVQNIQVGKLKSEFSSVLEQVKQGKEFIIEYGRAHKQVAKLVPIEIKKPRERKFGQLEGKIHFNEDEFFAADKEISDLIYDSPIFPKE